MSSRTANRTRATLAFTFALCLVACGGGGSNTPPPAVTAPAISVQPLDTNTSVGASVTFSVTATGNGLSYQWQRDGVDLAGATGAQYVLPAAQFNDSGSKWSVVVRNSAGSATSAQATLSLTGSALLAGSPLTSLFDFDRISGIAPDDSGNIYALEIGQQFRITLHKVDSRGVATQVPLTPRYDNTTPSIPSGLVRAPSGDFYVADSSCTLKKISAGGEITVVAGDRLHCGHDDGKGSAATLAAISALAVDAANNVFIADTNSLIRKITPDGNVTTLAGAPNAYEVVDGIGSAAHFGRMKSMAIDGAGNLYVTDNAWFGIPSSIRKITPDGLVSTLAGGVSSGFADGRSGEASFRTLSGMTIDGAGNLYVADRGNHSIRKITPNGVVTTFAGQPTIEEPSDTENVDGPVATAKFRQPLALAMDKTGNLFVAEGNSASGAQVNALRKISTDGMVRTIGGSMAGRGANDGMGPAAGFWQPLGLAVDATGKIWVADTGNQLIRQVSPNGTVTTIAGATGTATMDSLGDGKGALASFDLPLAIAVDSSGTAFVADAFKGTIRRVSADGTVTTLAGKGKSGPADGIGLAASFAYPNRIAVDKSGTLYVTDSGAIRRINPATGEVTTLAGVLNTTYDAPKDGNGTAARLGQLMAIATDNTGNVYVADASTVRKVTPDGVVTTLAGTFGITGSADGQGAAASFYYPQGLTVDAAGNVYVADFGNNLIRRITPAGAVTTVAGKVGANGIDLGSLKNALSRPTGIAFGANGILYISASNGIFQLRLQ